MPIEINVLGPVDCRVDGQPINLGGPRQRRLLAHLALRSGSASSFSSVVRAVWPDEDQPDDPRRAVHTAVSRLRSSLGAERVVARDGGYALELDEVVVDALRFEEMIGRARRSSDRDAVVGELADALALWRGPALDGFEHESWAQPTAVRLEELRDEAVDDWAELSIGLGFGSGVVAVLEEASRRSQLRERTHRILMTALHREGRQAEALRVFQRYRHRLATELGLEPGDQIVALEQAIAIGTSVDALNGPSAAALTVRGYDLHEVIGVGSHAVVYRGTQPGVRRDVAIKVIRSELADRVEFIRSFESEAMLVARIEHPHIVPLYDYWREPGTAVLVMRYYAEGSLQDLLATRSLSLSEAGQLARQVGGALSAAHESGAVHRDVKPGNIFVDRLGNFVLGDFGVASETERVLTVDGHAPTGPDSSVWAVLHANVDVRGLATTIHLALGIDGSPAPTARPAELDSVLGQAMDRNPGRFETVAAFVAAFVTTLVGASVVASSSSGELGHVLVGTGNRNPYKGLRPFDEADEADFCGRELLVERLVNRLTGDDGRFIVLVGPSGSGKSSVVRAGLIPRLRARTYEGRRRLVTTMFPGNRPFDELERALGRIAPASAGDIGGLLREGPRGLARALGRLIPADGDELVLVIDQAEELYTLTADVDRSAFLDAVFDAMSEPRPQLSVVMTLRADFYDRPLRDPRVGPVLEAATLNVPPMTLAELDAAIVQPAARVGVRFEPGLASRIADDVIREPGALPLLQYALTSLIDDRSGDVITAVEYEAGGGLAGALTRRADSLVEHASYDLLISTELTFTRLVTPGDGVPDTRRRVLMSELGHLPHVDEVVARFGDARLLSFDHDPVTRQPTIEVAHEALIQAWPRLRAWVDADRDGLRLHHHLTAAATEWRASGDDGELYRGGRLESADAWATAHPEQLSPEEFAFLDRSRIVRRTEGEAELRSARRVRRALLVVATVAVVALVAGGLAVSQRNRARASAADAAVAALAASDAAASARTERDAKSRLAVDLETKRLAGLAPSLAETDLPVALLVAAEAAKRSSGPETWDALQRVLLAAGPTIGYFPETEARAVFFDHGRLIGVSDTAVTVWDLATGAQMLRRDLEVPVAESSFESWTPVDYGGGWLAWVAFGDGDPERWVQDGFDIWLLDLFGTDAPRRLRGHSVAIDPTGSTLITGFVGGEMLAMSIPELEPRWTIAADGVMSVADSVAALAIPGDGFTETFDTPAGPGPLQFTADGSRLLAQRLGRLDVVDMDSGEIVAESAVYRSYGNRVALSTLGRSAIDGVTVDAFASVAALRSTVDGTVLAEMPLSMLADDEAVRFSVMTGPTTALLVSPTGAVTSIDFSTGAELETFDVGIGRIANVGLSPTGDRVAFAGKAGIAVLALDGSGPLNAAVPRADDHLFPSGGADARWVAIEANPPPTLVPTDRIPGRFWICPDVSACTESIALDQRSSQIVSSQNTRPDVISTRVLQLGGLGAWTLVDSITLEPVGHFEPGGIGQPGFAVAPDLSWMALARDFVRAIVVFASDGTPIREFSFPEYGDLAQPKLAVDSTGASILVTDVVTGRSALIDTATWTVSAAPLPEGETVIAQYSPDGRYLATVGVTGDLVLRDARTLEIVRTFAGDAQPSHTYAYQLMAFSDDGQFLVTVYEGRGRLWDVESGRSIGAPFPSLAASQPAALPGQHVGLLTTSDDWVEIWNLDPSSWRDIACRLAGRNLTAEEWERFGPADEPHRPTCEQWPAGSATS